MTERSACYTCGTLVSESETVVTRSRERVCLSCAALVVGRKHHQAREAFSPGPDPETQPREWERAWSARRRRRTDLQQIFIDEAGPFTRTEIRWIYQATTLAAGDEAGLERALDAHRNVIVVKAPTA